MRTEGEAMRMAAYRWHLTDPVPYARSVSATSSRRGGRLWLLILPLAVLAGAREMVPKLPAPESRDLGLFLASDLSSNTTGTVLPVDGGYLAR